MNLRSILMLLLLLLSGFSSFGCSASQSNANAGTEPFEIFTEHTNKQTEAKAWATCATIYSLHEQALEDGLNRPQFARHLSVIQNDYERGEYEQEAISRRV